MEWLNWIQWPAMAVTVVAAWMIASRKKFKRQLGVLAFPVKQRVVDCVGITRPRLCFDSVATGAGDFEYKRGRQDSRELGVGFTFHSHRVFSPVRG